MKAKPVPEGSQLDLSSEVTKSEPLLNSEQIAVRFTDFGGKIETYKKYAADLKIDSADTLMVAENTSSEILEVFNSVERVRKIFKDPYFLTGKAIDEYSKKLSDPLDKVRKDINGTIANYKSVQAAFAAEKAKKEQEALKLIEDAKLEEIDKIARIAQQLNARIYGGYWMNKSDMRQSSAGCINEDQCDELLKMIDEKVPKADTYTYYGEKHADMIKDAKKRLATQKINVHNANVDSKEIRAAAQEKIQTAKVTADVQTLEEKEYGAKQVAREIKKEEKAIISVVKETRKGLKKILKFTIVEPDKVGNEFWTIDEEKIRTYMNEHNEEIKAALQENKESLPGIKFFIDENYTSQ